MAKTLLEKPIKQEILPTNEKKKKKKKKLKKKSPNDVKKNSETFKEISNQVHQALKNQLSDGNSNFKLVPKVDFNKSNKRFNNRKNKNSAPRNSNEHQVLNIKQEVKSFGSTSNDSNSLESGECSNTSSEISVYHEVTLSEISDDSYIPLSSSPNAVTERANYNNNPLTFTVTELFENVLKLFNLAANNGNFFNNPNYGALSLQDSNSAGSVGPIRNNVKKYRQCWNCHSSSHTHGNCYFPKTHVYCFKCGHPGVTVKSCKFCNS